MTKCAVCSRSLSDPSSVARGTGPVCAKNVARFISQLQSSDAAAASWENWARSSDGARVGVDDLAISAARAQFLARIRRQSIIPVASGSIESLSGLRGRSETLRYEQFENGAVITNSRSGMEYVVTTDETGRHPVHCSCPDHQFRGSVCRHMQAYSALAGRAESTPATQSLSPDTPAVQSVPDVRTNNHGSEQNRIVQVPTIILSALQSEADREWERDQNIAVWADQHSHDGIFISSDDSAWRSLLQEAKVNMGSFESERALDGINNTFGIELEVEGVDRAELARALYESGLSSHATDLSYSARAASGSWCVKRDGSLDSYTGAEIVSPILRDTPETWTAVQEISKILKQKGATTSSRTGFHIHMGHDVLDDRGYRWQRLGKYMLGYSNAYYRMGAASKTSGTTPHRGTGYTQELHRGDVVRLSRHDDAREASRKIIGYHDHDDRYKMLNTAKFIENNVPTVEFRYPNGTTEAVVVQRQVQLVNSTMMQSAFLRKGLPGADRLPALHRTDQSVELSNNEEMRFRQYLDTLGSHRLRLIATQLWARGAA